MTGRDWKMIRDGFVAALVAFATIGGVGGSKLAARRGRGPGLAKRGPSRAERELVRAAAARREGPAPVRPCGPAAQRQGPDGQRQQQSQSDREGWHDSGWRVFERLRRGEQHRPLRPLRALRPISSGVERIESPQTPSSDGANLDDPPPASRTIRSARATSTCPTGTSCSWEARHVSTPASSSSARSWRGSSTGRPRAGSQPAK